MAEMVPEAKQTYEMRQAIDKARECERICQETFNHCLEMGGRHAAPSHLRILLDCAEVCGTASGTLLRGAVNGPLWAACIAACEVCEASCRNVGDDDQMRACAEACRACADACAPLAS